LLSTEIAANLVDAQGGSISKYAQRKYLNRKAVCIGARQRISRCCEASTQLIKNVLLAQQRRGSLDVI